MKATFIGGSYDGDEVDLPPGMPEWLWVKSNTRPTFQEMINPRENELSSTELEKWPIRKVKAPSGRTITAIVNPKLDDWLRRNFDGKGKKDGSR